MRVIKKLILFYTLFVVVKSILSYFIVGPTMFLDEVVYAKMARSFFYNFNFNFLGEPHKYPPLYPLVLSISYFFKNMVTIYTVMKIINALASSLIIFPAYLMAKEFFSKKKSFLIAILISILPINFAFSSYILSENLFFSLSLFAFYFIYKSFINLEYKWDILAGIFIGLCILTKIIVGLVFIPLIIIGLVYKIYKKEFIQIKKKIILLILSSIVVLPLIIKNIIAFGLKSKEITGYSGLFNALETRLSLVSTAYWFLAYITYIIISCGVLFFILALFTKKTKKVCLFKYLLLALFFILLIIVALHGGTHPKGNESWLVGRIVGRYIAMIFPLIIILGAIGLKQQVFKYVLKKKILLIGLMFSFLFLFSYRIITLQLFPVNNISVGYLGLINHVLDLIKINRLIIMLPLFFITPLVVIYIYIKTNLSFNRILILFCLFFLITSLISFSIGYYNANQWDNLDQMKLGKWIDKENLNGKFLFDFDGINEKNIREEVYLGTSWVNKEIKLGRSFENINYFVTKNEFELPLVKRIGKVYMYKINELNEK